MSWQKQHNPVVPVAVSKPMVSSGGRHRRHTSIHPEREASTSGPLTSTNAIPEYLTKAVEQLCDLGFLSKRNDKNTFFTHWSFIVA